MTIIPAAMDRAPVDSSAIASIGYAPEDQLLEVEFCSGRVYQYLDVPAAEHENLIAADSIGRWFNKHIRELYDRREVPPEERD